MGAEQFGFHGMSWPSFCDSLLLLWVHVLLQYVGVSEFLKLFFMNQDEQRSFDTISVDMSSGFNLEALNLILNALTEII